MNDPRPQFDNDEIVLLAGLITFALVLIFLLGMRAQAADQHSQLVTVRRNASARGVAIYELRAIDSSAVTLMSDADLPIAKWLAEHRDTRVTITLEAK